MLSEAIPRTTEEIEALMARWTFGGMGMKLKIQARAKINWTLDVVGTLPNGYHDLDMLMQSVTLCDQMTMEEAPQLSLYVRAQGRAFVPADGNNLVLKAAAALQAATGCTRGARITLKKYIPVAAGMGGGSSDDAAAALVGLNRLWGWGSRRTGWRNRSDRRRGRAVLRSRRLAAGAGRGRKADAAGDEKSRCIWWRFSPAGAVHQERSSPRCTRTASAARTGRITRRRSARWPQAMFRARRGAWQCARAGFAADAPGNRPRHSRHRGERRGRRADDGQRIGGFRRVHARRRMPTRQIGWRRHIRPAG